MRRKRSVTELGEEKIPTLVGRYFLNTFTALFFSALYTIVDSVFVSRGIGSTAMGGVAIVGPFMMIQAAVAQTVGSGAASIISRYLGKKQYTQAGEVTVNAMAVFYATAILVTAVGLLFTDPILRLLGVTDELMPYAREYFFVIVCGTVFSTGFSSLIRAEGRMTYALLIWLIPTGVNIVLDGVFIFGLGMGVRGAALATVLCQCTSCGMWFLFLVKFSEQKLWGAKIRISVIREILGIGLPTFLQMSGSSFMNMVLNRLLGAAGGAVSVTCYAYMTRVSGCATVPFNALTQAISPIIGYNDGAKNESRISQTLRFSLVAGTVYSGALLILAQFLSGFAIEVLTDEVIYIQTGAQGLRILSLAAPMLPLCRVTSAYFQAVGNRRYALILNLIVFAVLPLLALIFSIIWSDTGVYWSFLPAYGLVAAISGMVLLQDRRLRT